MCFMRNDIICNKMTLRYDIAFPLFPLNSQTPNCLEFTLSLKLSLTLLADKLSYNSRFMFMSNLKYNLIQKFEIQYYLYFEKFKNTYLQV